MDLGLAGNTAIVTGASRGIGKAIARQLALEGVDVAIVARTIETLEATAKELAAETGHRILPIPTDTGDDESVAAMVQQAAAAFGHLDILVNCAAQASGSGPARIADVTDAEFFGDTNVKVMGYIRCARQVAPHMRRQGWGRIINLGGMRSRHTGEMLTSIRSTAVVALTKVLADELGPDGISVTAIHPGPTRTEGLDGLIARRAQQDGISPEEVERRMLARNVLRRVITDQDLANVAAFLASPRSVAINGTVIVADGGAPGEVYY